MSELSEHVKRFIFFPSISKFWCLKPVFKDKQQQQNTNSESSWFCVFLSFSQNGHFCSKFVCLLFSKHHFVIHYQQKKDLSAASFCVSSVGKASAHSEFEVKNFDPHFETANVSGSLSEDGWGILIQLTHYLNWVRQYHLLNYLCCKYCLEVH